MNNYYKDASVVGTKSPYARRSIVKAVVTLSLLLPALLLFAASARATTIYVSQNGGTFSGGSACNGQTAISASTFNSTTLSVGETVYLCGTITSQLAPKNGGSSGNVVTLQWDTGASVQVCNTTAAVNIGGLSYLTLDLGGNSTALECPNNGIGLSTQTEAIGIGDAGRGWSHIEIRHGTIGPIFVYSGTSNSGFGSVCINGSYAPSYSHIHHLTFSGCAYGIQYQIAGNTDSDEFDHNTVGTSVGSFLWYADGVDATYTASNGSVHDNDFNYSSVWSVPGGYEHYEVMDIYNRGPDNGAHDAITNFQIYNNYFHGSSPNNSGSTAMLEMSWGLNNCGTTSTAEIKIFNNLIVDAGGGEGWSSESGGFFYDQGCDHTVSVYNNTMIGTNNSINSCFETLEGVGAANSVNTWTVKNNICTTMQFAFYNPQSVAPTTFTENYNDFYNILASGFGGYMWKNADYYTLASWRSVTGQDANSITTNPNLSASYVPNTGSPVIGVGTNLTSLGITALDTGAPQTFGVTGACGTGCLSRPSSGAWDLGAYQSGSAVAAPNPPTNLTATPH